MANHKSAIKRIRQNEKKRMRNKSVRTLLRTRFNQFENAIKEGDVAQAETLFRNAESALHRAASKGIIPRSRAARKTGRLAAQLNTLRNA